MKVGGSSNSAKSVHSVTRDSANDPCLGHERSFTTFLWRVSRVVNKRIKSEMMRPSTLLMNLVLAAPLQECWEHTDHRASSEVRSACSYFIPNLEFARWAKGFSNFAKGLATVQQQNSQRTKEAFALSVVFAYSYWTSLECWSFFGIMVSATSRGVRHRLSVASVAKKSNAPADGLMTAQQLIFQWTWGAFAISVLNLCVIFFLALCIVSRSLKECRM